MIKKRNLSLAGQGITGKNFCQGAKSKGTHTDVAGRKC